MDLPNIYIVVQWKVTSNMCMLWQQFGHGAWGIGITAVARKLLILMYILWKNNTEFESTYANQIEESK